MSQIENLQWLNRNSLRAFPIVEESQRRAQNTNLQLPNDVLVDAFIVTEDSPQGVYVSALSFTDRIVSVVLSDVQTGASLATTSAVIGLDDINSRKPLHPLVSNVSGYITFGSVLDPQGDISALKGSQLFASEVRLETRCVLNSGPIPVPSLAIKGKEQDPLYGVVEFRHNDAMTITPSTEGEVTYLIFDLLEPEKFLNICHPKGTICDCVDPIIRTIDGVGPDGTGNITIELIDATAQVTTVGNTIQLLITRSSDQICIRPAVPDVYGRLPLPYNLDCPPVTNYGINPGPACSNP